MTLVPSTDTIPILVSPNLDSSEVTVFSKTGKNISLDDWIVGVPYSPQLVEAEILSDIEHWIG